MRCPECGSIMIQNQPIRTSFESREWECATCGSSVWNLTDGEFRDLFKIPKQPVSHPEAGL